MEFIDFLTGIRDLVTIGTPIIGEDIGSRFFGNNRRLSLEGNIPQENMVNVDTVGIDQVVLAGDRIGIDEIIYWLNLEEDLCLAFTKLVNIIGARLALEETGVIRCSPARVCQVDILAEIVIKRLLHLT